MTRRAALAGALLGGLLLAGSVLTGARLLDPRSELGVQLQAYTPVAVLPYAVALVVLLVLAVRRATRRPALLVPVLVALVGLGLHAAWLAPSFAGEGREPAPGAVPTVVLSANVYFGRGDGRVLVREAADRGADVLVVSEVTPRTLAEMEDAGVDDLLPHRAGRPQAENEGTMVFSRRPISGATPVPGTSFDNLLVRTGGLAVLAAHPAAPLDPAAWREDHAALLALVRRERPDVVVGDLNATLDHAPVRALVDAGYRDSAELLNAGLQPTWPANGLYPVLGLLPASAPIDHLLLAPGWTATRTGTVEVPRTDHLALIAAVVPAA